MSAEAEPERQRPKDSAGTLGDVLYADKAPAILENEWAEIVAAIAAADQRALHALYERTHRMVFTLAFRLTNNRETAEEVTVDVFHDVWRRAAQYDAANGTVIGWVMNQARSRAIDRVRLEQRKKRVDPMPDSPDSTTAVPLPLEALELQEQGNILRAAVAALTPQERQAIETAYFSELTYAETADRLSQPLGTIKTRIRSALGKLRDALAGTVKL
jgi:RNA polymerase sigma-70 factor (ECF subfamily)